MRGGSGGGHLRVRIGRRRVCTVIVPDTMYHDVHAASRGLDGLLERERTVSSRPNLSAASSK